MSQSLFVRAKKRAGFRRAGEYFPFEGKSIDTSHFSEEQLTLIKREPQLVIAIGPQTAIETFSQERIEDIIEAIDMMTPDKKPNVKELESILDHDISASERDKAWKIYRERVNAA